MPKTVNTDGINLTFLFEGKKVFFLFLCVFEWAEKKKKKSQWICLI